MKTRLSSLVRFLSILFLAVWALAPRASAQPRPSLGLGFSAGQPTLSLTGEVGSVYSIQYGFLSWAFRQIAGIATARVIMARTHVGFIGSRCRLLGLLVSRWCD